MSQLPTSTERVVYRRRDRVGELVLNRPESANAIDLETARELAAAIRRAREDAAVDVVLLRGRGTRFCAGGDLAAMAAAPDRPAFVAELAHAAHEAVRALDGLDKPVVVAVQGSAAGVGLSLVLGADLVIASESATFVTAYTSVGLTPDGGMSWLLPRVVGQRRALELILTSTPVTAAHAHELGIVSQVCAEEELVSIAREAAETLAARPAHAIGAARRLVRESWTRSLDSHLDIEAETIAHAADHDQSRRLIDRFLAKRRPAAGLEDSDHGRTPS